MSNPTGICFVSIEAYATLRPGVSDIAGGAGFQVVQLGRRLTDLGHEVSYVVGDFGQPFRDVAGGFTTYRASRISGKKNPFRGLANAARIFRAMRAARAKHYVLRANRNLVFFVLIFSKLLGARFTFMVADHRHVTKRGIAGMNGVIRSLYRWSLRNADRVTVQTEEQKRLLMENIGVRGFLVPSGIVVPPLPEPGRSHDVSFVGSIKPIKRPDRFADIARRLPGRRFVVAGGPGSQSAGDRDYYDKMVSTFESLPNVTYRGFVPPDEVGEVYRGGRLLLLTSDFEGFPNAFLHAWASGIPTCSIDVDPDDVIEKKGLGIVDTDLDSLASRIDSLLSDQAEYDAMRLRCHEHARENHSLERLEAAFVEALPE